MPPVGAAVGVPVPLAADAASVTPSKSVSSPSTICPAGAFGRVCSRYAAFIAAAEGMFAPAD